MTELGKDKLGVAGDEFYELLLKAHEGLSETESMELNSRLVLLFANEVGDIRLLKRALDKAKKSKTDP